MCIIAAANGHLDCLKYAHKNGYSWNKRICEEAAYNSHLDCLKYAHENGCPWDEKTCASAVKNRELDCLKYAHENGCPCDFNCNSITWCEYRCDVCWRYDCRKHDTAKTFKQMTKHNHVLYKDVVNEICSFL